jgi:hypothetical protein
LSKRLLSWNWRALEARDNKTAGPIPKSLAVLRASH